MIYLLQILSGIEIIRMHRKVERYTDLVLSI